MPTVAEILKSTGLTDEQIAALDAKVVGGFTQVLSTATQTLEQAELAKRSYSDMYEKEIAPALDGWANDKASYDAKIAAYEAALKSAKEGGFKIPDILTPAATPGSPVRDPKTGAFVASGTVTTPAVDLTKLRDELGGAFAFAADTSWKYRTLYGTEMPDSPTTIIREAAAQRMPPGEYAAKKYDFAGKEKAQREAKEKEREEQFRKDEREKVTKELTEKFGSNPMLRQAADSGFSQISKAVHENKRPDPLKAGTREQRREMTRQHIQAEIAQNETIQ